MVLVRMHHAEMLHHWIQQKADFPLHAMNEIHGSWSDPSNRVINFSECFRDDLAEDWEIWCKKVKVCLTLGTSLSNMTSDDIVSDYGNRGKLSP